MSVRQRFRKPAASVEATAGPGKLDKVRKMIRPVTGLVGACLNLSTKGDHYETPPNKPGRDPWMNSDNGVREIDINTGMTISGNGDAVPLSGLNGKTF